MISVKEVQKRQKELLIFWHPDKNRSIIATDMCKEITYEAGELIQSIQKLQAIQEKIDPAKQDISLEEKTTLF